MKCVRARLVAVALGLDVIAASRPLSGQQPPALVRWQRVRVTAPSVGLVRNVFAVESVTADSVILVRQPSPGRLDTICLARVALQTLEVSKRRGSLALPGFFVGLGVGAVWAAHWATHTSNPFTPFEGTYGDNAGGILLRVGAGGLAGAIAGSLIHFEKWTAVPLGELRIDLRPRPGSQLGFGALLTL